MSDFDWIKDRFDKVDKDNEKILTDLSAVKLKVERHGVYWSITKWGATLGVGSLLSYFGLKK